MPRSVGQVVRLTLAGSKECSLLNVERYFWASYLLVMDLTIITPLYVLTLLCPVAQLFLLIYQVATGT